MNATVARIVEIMFQDTKMTDEVIALKDEVMNNCQERFDDMMARGMTEDEAIAAVVDSLKGMEEVIGQYPRKNEPSDEDLDALEKEFEELDKEFEDMDNEFEEMDSEFEGHDGGDRAMWMDDEGNPCVDPENIRRVELSLLAEDVYIEPSEDGHIHVRYDREELPGIAVKAEGETLRINREGWSTRSRTEKKGTKRIWINGREVLNLDSLSDLLSSVKEMTQTVVSIGRNGDIHIALPQNKSFVLACHTTSGDVQVDDVTLSEVVLESTSGDASIDLSRQSAPELVRIKGSSGDVDVKLNTRELNVQTMSGDVGFDGTCRNLTVSTVSGDAEINGDVTCLRAKSISGDLNMTVFSDALTELVSHTTSGDLTLRLPESLRGCVYVETKTVSGDVRNRWGNADPATAKATVRAQSVSGDVTIR